MILVVIGNILTLLLYLKQQQSTLISTLCVKCRIVYTSIDKYNVMFSNISKPSQWIQFRFKRPSFTKLTENGILLLHTPYNVGD